MTESAEILAARQAMIAKRFGGSAAQMGGKGTMRRKKKTASKSSAGETDRKLNAAVKKLGATNIPGIEEVNLFKEDGKVVHFVNPKVRQRRSFLCVSSWFVLCAPAARNDRLVVDGWLIDQWGLVEETSELFQGTRNTQN